MEKKMERIRYSKKEDGSLVSVQTFQHPSNGAKYVAIIALGKFTIRDATNQNLVSILELSPSVVLTVNELKKRVREELTRLGIVLSTEKRAPRKPKV